MQREVRCFMLLSQIEQARRATIFTKAQGKDLDILAHIWGLDRPVSFPPAYWAEVMRSIVYRSQGTYSQIFNMLYWMFKPWTLQETHEVIISSTGQFTIPTGASKGLCNKLVRITCASNPDLDGWYYVDAYSETGVPPLLVKRLRLNTTHTTSYFKAWSSASSVNCTIEFVPFLIFEGIGSLTIFIDSTLALTPASYLKENNEERNTNEPFGGHVMTLWDSAYPGEPSFGNQETGPFPIYLSGNDLSDLYAQILKNTLAAGIQYKVYSIDWENMVSYEPISIYAKTGLFPNLP